MEKRNKTAVGSEDGMNGNTLRLPEGLAARLRIWEIPSFFKCPLIGLCLTFNEQKQLLKKADIPWKDKNPFQIHETLVGNADSENKLSTKIDQLLVRKFERLGKPLRLLPEEAWRQHCRAGLDSGQIQLPFWVTATRPDLSDEAKQEIFGTVHMSLFTNAALDSRTKQKMGRLEKEIAEQSRKVSNWRQQCRCLQEEKTGLQKELASWKARVGSLEKENEGLKKRIESASDLNRLMDLEKENEAVKTALAEKTKDLQLTERAARMCQRDAVTDGNSEKQQPPARQWGSPGDEPCGACPEERRCEADCPVFNVCQKRVLIVGGISRMEKHYRQLIESNGGRLEYHDGSMNGGGKQLKKQLKRADIVLCPIHCNSHAACSLVKKLGRKYDKFVHLMNSVSLSAISQMVKGTGYQEPN
jgi:hypothetical protein